MSSFQVNDRGKGSAQYPPSMLAMLAALLIYCYATGRFESRRIEDATYSDVAVRFITGDHHPDRDTICYFRRRNRRAFQELFVKVLAVRREAMAAHEAKLAEREQKRRSGRKPRGREPKPPPEAPPGNRQYNFTDPESHIMKAGSGPHFEQCYNAQAAVDTEGSMMIPGCRVTSEPNDKKELEPTVNAVDESVRTASHVLADNGYLSEPQIEAVGADDGPVVYVATGKTKHGRTVRDLRKKEDPPPHAEDASTTEKMTHRMQTARGRACYKPRKETVEPTFGIVENVLGFRQFHLRGHPKQDAPRKTRSRLRLQRA